MSLTDSDKRQIVVDEMYATAPWCDDADKRNPELAHRNWCVARFLKNQRFYFEELRGSDEGGPTRSILESYFGPNYETVLLKALGRHFFASPIHDLVSVQPFEGAPLHVAQFYSPPEIRVAEDGVTECNMRLLSQEIRAHSRGLGAMHMSKAAMADLREIHRVSLDEIGRINADNYAKTVWEEILRSCLADLRIAAKSTEVRRADSSVHREIQRQSLEIWRHTLRGPANRVVASPAFGLEDGSDFQVVYDPLYPADEVLVLHQGPSALVAGYVFSPYMIRFSPVSLDQFEQQLGSAFRGAHLLVDGRLFKAIKFA